MQAVVIWGRECSSPSRRQVRRLSAYPFARSTASRSRALRSSVALRPWACPRPLTPIRQQSRSGRFQPDGNVAADTVAPEPVIRLRAGALEITLTPAFCAASMRCAKRVLPLETGGILFGLVDISAKRIHLVDASPAPPDSQQRRGEFVRGVEGVEELWMRRPRSAGQVRYVGEWHSDRRARQRGRAPSTASRSTGLRH